MQRQEFIGVIGSAAAFPLEVRAQQPAKMKRIAMVHPTRQHDDKWPSLVPSFFRGVGRAED